MKFTVDEILCLWFSKTTRFQESRRFFISKSKEDLGSSKRLSNLQNLLFYSYIITKTESENIKIAFSKRRNINTRLFLLITYGYYVATL